MQPSSPPPGVANPWELGCLAPGEQGVLDLGSGAGTILFICRNKWSAKAGPRDLGST